MKLLHLNLSLSIRNIIRDEVYVARESIVGGVLLGFGYYWLKQFLSKYMVMERQLRTYNNLDNRIKYDQNFIGGFNPGDIFTDQNLVNFSRVPPDSNSGVLVQSCSVITEGDSHEDCDFSDVDLKYINQMLMEEDMEEKTCMFQESAALQAAERSFYEVLGEKYPPSPDHYPSHSLNQNIESPDECHAGAGWSSALSDHQSVSADIGSCSTYQSSVNSFSSAGIVVDGLADSSVSTLWLPDMLNNRHSSVGLYERGVDGLCLDLGSNLVKEPKEEAKNVVVKVEKRCEIEYTPDGLRGKKNPHREDLNLDEGRSNKQSAVYAETTVRSEMFNMVLLCNWGKSEYSLCEALQNKVNKNTKQNGQPKGSQGGRTRGKKQGSKRDLVDLENLLTQCAQAVTTNDQRRANDLLKQIRQHCSPTGSGMQRIAYYFAHGLEARMASSGIRSYMAVTIKPTSAAEFLKAYHLFLAVCPFKKLSNFFSNKTIMKVAEKATRLHIIDFGILYGFQWPSLIQKLSSRPGGPPKLRITGIELPNPGFRPAERVEETGCRLANYAESFNVPFEFNAIAQKWETIQLEDLKFDPDEVLVVNCHHRFRNLLDETVVAKSPRNMVLKLIRKMNPEVFIQGVVNGTYNAPFFISRFREALHHYSSLFDILETNVPREMHERLLLEKEIFGWEAMNVIACEGAERIERPETYKQWQVRSQRAGFRQLPLDREITSMAKHRMRTCYHKDFLVDEDGHWMLQGWRGRLIYAVSCWKPAL